MKLALVKTLKEVYSIVLKDLGAYGGFPFYGIVILASLMAGEINFALLLSVSLVVVTVAVSLIRLAFPKPRPGRDKAKYATYYETIDNSSFPSIHAARAVMLSMALLTKFPTFAPLFALLTLLVCLSRIHFKRHFLIDITVGLVLGFLLGFLFF